uniref:DNA-(apurinic or apyrimidinic site) endonuclease n=1 Tax=Scophthalmus maximus TaxID=52904 RepID=A0A8D3CHI0_SCOMX
MKIITWNINGIRTFGGGVKKTLDSLDADVICVQETKVTRDLLDERSAIVDGYNSYFSYSRGRSGYSGVATYCKDSATPCAAEEGLTGLLTGHEGAVGCYGDHTEFSGEELQLLDNEGRAVITQHRVMCEDKVQTVTVINVYCPRADPDKPERKQFKLQFYKLLQCRAEALLKDGSHVIILGDVNTSHRPIDHCDPSDVDQFGENPGRKWLNVFLHQPDEDRNEDEEEEPDEESEGTSTDSVRGGKFVDTFRYFHPTRSSAFTCWSTLTGARQTNYGTRIDYIFADRRLVREQFVAADIMPEVEGSDHCPVWGRLRCPLVPSSKPPPLCTRYLPEFAGRQQKLSRFLVKVEPTGGGEERENLNPLAAGNVSGRKRALASAPVVPKGKKTKTVKTCSKPQGSLLSFFKPKPTTNAVPLLTLRPGSVTKSLRHRTHTKRLQPEKLSRRMEDPKLQRMRVPHRGVPASILHGPPPPPSCKVHGEPCVLRTVKKEGPNMGKQFFVCARPQGHASNPEARCNFFSWVEKGK